MNLFYFTKRKGKKKKRIKKLIPHEKQRTRKSLVNKEHMMPHVCVR